MWLLLIVTAIFISLIYLFLTKPLEYWKKKNVPHSKPWPIFGNVAPFAFGKKSSQEMFNSLYEEFPDNRYIGIHLLFARPALLIRDPELIKQITIKDFDYFTDHAIFNGIEEIDPEISKSLPMLHGEKWRSMRSTLTSCFTASKMKLMFNLISESAMNCTEFLQKQYCGAMSLEMNDIFSRYIIDATASSAFGLKIDSLVDKENKFFEMSNNICNFKGLRAFRLLIYSAFPIIMQILKLPAFPQKYMNYFSHVFEDIIDTREGTGIIRPDMIHIFLERRKIELLNKTNKVKDLSDDSLKGQAITFLVASFINTTNVLCFLSYELALNPNVQQKLHKEIDETLGKCNGEITYETLSDMKYMDMVIQETLRLWPAASTFDRICVKDYVIDPKLPNEEPLLVEKGTTLLFSLAAIQHDAKYFPDPLKFDPERFSDENQKNIKPYTNIPFGAGPRYCIAHRFVFMEIKILIFHLLSKFDIVTTEKTMIPVVQGKLQLNLGAEGGMWLGLKQRKLVE